MRRWMVWAMAGWVCSSAPTWAQCVGDCDESGSVTVNELVTGVNIALSRASLEVCASFDSSGDEQVVVNELIGAVGNALRGCRFAGHYVATVPLGDDVVGIVDLTSSADGHATGVVRITHPAALQALQIGAVVSITGSFDPQTGAFEVSGSFRGGDGELVNVRLSGQLGSEFTLQIGDTVYTNSFTRPPTATPTPTATPSGAVHHIQVGDPVLPFDPEVLEIDPGDTVVWTWIGGPHSVRSAALNQINQPSCTATGLFDSGERSTGPFSYTFTAPGRYGFHCGVADHCEHNFEYGYIDVRGTPSPTVTRTWTATATVAIPTATATPDTIGGVSTRMIGTFSGIAMVGTQMLAARLQIQVNDPIVTVTDLSTFPNIFPNPVQMTVLSPTSLSYQAAGPPPTSFTLSLNDQGHLIGHYAVTDPIMPHLPADFDLTRE